MTRKFTRGLTKEMRALEAQFGHLDEIELARTDEHPALQLDFHSQRRQPTSARELATSTDTPPSIEDLRRLSAAILAERQRRDIAGKF